MSFVLWIRGEVFDHGVFNTSVRWTVPKVFDFLASLLDATGGATTLSRASWTEVTTSQSRPTLNEAEAAAYWQVITVLQQSIMGDTGDSLDIRIVGIILVCQVFTLNRVGKTDQFARSGEMWPGLERSTGALSSPRHSPRGVAHHYTAASGQGALSRGPDLTAALIAFMRQHVGHFLQVACLTLAHEPQVVRVEEFDLLGMVLQAGTSFQSPLWRVSEAVPELCHALALPLQQLKHIVHQCLDWNSLVYSFEPSSTMKATQSRTVNIASMSKTTWCPRPMGQDIDYLNITGCTDCCIYVMSTIRFCLVTGCHECSIVLGGVSTMCTVHNCEKISVHVAAHCFKMENSIDSAAYLYCHVAPILTGDTRGIKLAPYNVFYSKLVSVLEGAGMKPDPDFSDVWAHPICSTLGAPDETLGGRSSSMEPEPSNSTYHFVHPARFMPIIVPELERRPGLSCKLILPEVYRDAIQAREQETKAFHEQLVEIKDDIRRAKAHQAIQGHFREWLQTTGKSRQLADLVKLSQQLEKSGLK